MGIGFSEDGLMMCTDWQSIDDAIKAELDAKGVTGMDRYTYQTDVVKSLNAGLKEVAYEPFDPECYIVQMANAARDNQDKLILDILSCQGASHA